MKQLMAIGLVVIGAFVIFFLAQSGSFSPARSNSAAQNPGQQQTSNANQANSQTNTQNSQTNTQSAPVKVLCTLPPSSAPDIGGLKLGMNAEQVLALFPGSKVDKEVSADLAIKPSPFGEMRFTIKPDKFGANPKFAGINQITITLFDGAVSNINVSYKGPEWKSIDDFVTKFAGAENLPAADTWDAYPGMETQMKVLKCDGFEVNLFAGGKGGNLNYARIGDLVADRKLKERRAKAREKAMKEAKP